MTQTLHEAVEANGLYYPPDPASRGSCTIGGNVAENAGGPHAAKYGVTGRWVMGVEAVFADGRVAVTGGKTRKDVAGYDLTSLLVGSEGTLAVVTKAWLRLIPKPPHWATLVAPFPTLEDAARCRARDPPARARPLGLRVRRQARASTSRRGRRASRVPFPEAEARLLLEFDGAVRGRGRARRDAARARSPSSAARSTSSSRPTRRSGASLWDVRRGIAEAVHELGVSVELDLAVPRTELVPLVTRRSGGSRARRGSEVRRVRARGRRQPPRPPLARREGHGRRDALREDGDRDLRRDRAPRRHGHGRARRRHHVQDVPPALARRPRSSPRCAPSRRLSTRTGS